MTDSTGTAQASHLRATPSATTAVSPSRMTRGRADSRVSGPDPDSVADRLIRGLRVADPPERFQKLAVEVVAQSLGVELAAWLPGTSREPIVGTGSLPGLPGDSLRLLVPHPDPGTLWVANRSADSMPPGVRQLAVAAAASDAGPTPGRLVALNRVDGSAFGTEAEVLRTAADLIATQRANARLYAELKELLFGVIRALTSAIDAKDPYTSGHSERVARIAVRLAEQMGLSANDRGDLYLMGLLHDVGKIGIEDGVLKKAGKLSPEEFRRIQAHVGIGVHILSDLKKLHHLLPGIMYHHERLDGLGYPSGLSGEQIPLPARILAVADAFDAMSSDRPYRRRLPPERIDELMREGAGTQWDPGVIEALFACRDDVERIQQKGIGASLYRAVDDAMGRG